MIFLFILGFLSTNLAIIFYCKLIQITNALFASSVTYVIPIIEVIWGVIDGESLRIFHLFSLVLIVLGVWMVNRA